MLTGDLNRRGARIALALVAVMVFCGCWGPTESPRPSGWDEGFRIHFLKGDWDTLLDTANYLDESWPILSKVDLNEQLAFSVTIDDIDIYDWSRQVITLTPAGTEELERNLSDLQYTLYLKCFLITLNGNRLYGGVELFSGSAIAIHYPVVEVTLYLPQDVMTLTPGNPGRPFGDYPPEWQKVILRQDVHDYFASLGKLTE